MAIIRIFTGKDGQAHFEEVSLKFEARNDRSETAELIPGSGIIVRGFEPTRSNPWHNAPGHYAVFTLSGAVDIEIVDGLDLNLVILDIPIVGRNVGVQVLPRDVREQIVSDTG